MRPQLVGATTCHTQGPDWEPTRVHAMPERSLAPTLVRWRGRTQAFVERADGLVLTLLRIPAGEFVMGAPAGEPERLEREGPQHRVRLEEFLMGQMPITQAQWRVVAQWKAREGESWGRELDPNPSRFQSREGQGEVRLLEGETSTDQRPVENVSWYDAMEFCARLNQRTGRKYTLPSEAQWEYACRAGTTTPFYFGPTLTTDLANYDGTYTYANGLKGEHREQTTSVGIFQSNAWGLQDMHGNVWEWCLDFWHESYEGAPTDGSAWLHGEDLNRGKYRAMGRMLRGGSWSHFPRFCRSSYRFDFHPVNRISHVGFRVCCLSQD